MTNTLPSAILTVAMVAVLTLAPVAPEAGNLLFLDASAIALIMTWPSPLAQWQRPIVWMPLVGLGLLALAYGVSAGLGGLVGLAYFAPLLGIFPLVTLSQRIEPGPLLATASLFAFCGVVGATIMAVTEVQNTGTLRAGTSIANPIHFADVVMLVGLMALVGLVGSQRWLRAVCLAAPMLAIVPVGLSGTRGAVVAAAAALFAFVVTALLMRLLPRKTVIIGAIAFAGLAVVGITFGAAHLTAFQRVMADIYATLGHGLPTDESTSLRLQMYIGGLRAFLEAPIFGQGPNDFTVIANQLADTPFGETPHLHNDPLNMAASGGLAGVVAYILIVLAPLVEALRSPRSIHKSWTLVIAVALTTGFVVMGLTNAMFGILTVTVSFAAICVLMGLLSQPSPGQDDATLRSR